MDALLTLLPFRSRIWPIYPLDGLIGRIGGKGKANFGFDRFPSAVSNLNALLYALEHEAGLSALGRVLMFEALRLRCASRALVEEVLRAHGKEIERERIVKPLVGGVRGVYALKLSF